MNFRIGVYDGNRTRYNEIHNLVRHHIAPHTLLGLSPITRTSNALASHG